MSLQFTAEGKVLTISLFGAETPNGVPTQFHLKIPEAEFYTVLATMNYLISGTENKQK